ncbi:MAG: MATE family efflux transporter [Gammaproteobacteria bacterium]|nr:MATE family efflux transporter [Gammaproteobacteria bacterium]
MVALALGIVTLLIVSRAEHLYRSVDADPAIIPHAVAYVEVARWGLPGVMFYFVFRYLCDGIGETRPAMYVAFSALALKGLLNWIFVFGNLGAEAMGGAGCARSTVIVMWYECFIMLAVVSRPRFRVPTALFARFSLPDPRRIGDLFRLGVPIGLTAFFEIAAFSMVTLLVARFGAASVAAQQIASSVNGVIFTDSRWAWASPPPSASGHGAGGRPAAARRAGFVALGASLLFGLLAAGVLATSNEGIVGLFSNEVDVARRGSQLILFVALVRDRQTTPRRPPSAPSVATRTPGFPCWWPCSATGGSPCPWARPWASAGSANPWAMYGFWIGLATGSGRGRRARSCWRLDRLGPPDVEGRRRRTPRR